MADKIEHGMPEENYSSNIGSGNDVSENRESSENVKSPNKSKTVIIRWSDDVIQTCTRMCTTCLKRIDPDFYFSWEFMEFCNVLCISKFQGLNFKCIYCSHFINNTFFGKFYLRIQNMFRFFCSVPCMDHYKNIATRCAYCLRDPSSSFLNSLNSSDGTNKIPFCSEICCEIFNGVVKPRLPPKALCSVCKRDKPVDIILKHEGRTKYFCTKRCLIAYSFVKLKMDTEQCIMCQNYFVQTILRKYTVYYENIALVFCSSVCQNIYVLLKGKIVSCSWCQNQRYHFGMIRKFSTVSPQNIYICSVNCFKLYECSVFAGIPSMTTVSPGLSINNSKTSGTILPSSAKQSGCVDQFTNIDNNSDQYRNEDLYYLPCVENRQVIVHSKKPANQRNVATMCFIPKANKDVTAHPCTSHNGTQTDNTEILLPVPFPVYVPTPMAMYSIPTPTPVPFYLPIPVPIFIPVTKESAASIAQETQDVHGSIPNNPYEAELLKIADIIANDEKPSETNETGDLQAGQLHSFYDEVNNDRTQFENDSNVYFMKDKIGKKRLCEDTDMVDVKTSKRKLADCFTSIKKINLNYLLGITALQQWVKDKICFHKKSGKPNHIFKRDILQMLPDELNLVLDLFVKELKKPDRSDYASDTLYYLCLGIQYYLMENGRSDNIFMDKAYDKFSHTLNKLAEKYNSLYYEESHFIVTRVEEEHLWETKQLGHQSPLVLLNTLVYFNTKYYRCSTLEQHLDISFFQILKLWRKKSKSKTVMLRFHPKQIKGEKRVYEQYANESNRNRCPVNLYEFYLSKCPESIKTSKQLFYLQPEQYCTSDSPLWYMSSSLSKDSLGNMINRIKMVKEINLALLTVK